MQKYTNIYILISSSGVDVRQQYCVFSIPETCDPEGSHICVEGTTIMHQEKWKVKI